LTLLKSNSISISISNRDVDHETLATSRFEIEMGIEFDFKKKRNINRMDKLVKTYEKKGQFKNKKTNLFFNQY